MKTLTIILTDGPYISEYAEMAYKIAVEALKICEVNHIPLPGCSAHTETKAEALPF